MTSYQHRKSHCGYKTILQPSYLHNGISYTGRCHLYLESCPWKWCCTSLKYSVENLNTPLQSINFIYIIHIHGSLGHTVGLWILYHILIVGQPIVALSFQWYFFVLWFTPIRHGYESNTFKPKWHDPNHVHLSLFLLSRDVVSSLMILSCILFGKFWYIVLTHCGLVHVVMPYGIMKLGPRFNIKLTSYQYRKSHCGDKTVVRSSYLHNGISYTGKMSSLYWIRPQYELNTVKPIPNEMILIMFFYHCFYHPEM